MLTCRKWDITLGNRRISFLMTDTLELWAVTSSVSHLYQSSTIPTAICLTWLSFRMNLVLSPQMLIETRRGSYQRVAVFLVTDDR